MPYQNGHRRQSTNTCGARAIQQNKYRDFRQKVEMYDLENKPNKRPDNITSYWWWWALNYSGSDPTLGTGVIKGRLLTLYFILYSNNQESIAAPPLKLYYFLISSRQRKLESSVIQVEHMDICIMLKQYLFGLGLRVSSC